MDQRFLVATLCFILCLFTQTTSKVININDKTHHRDCLSVMKAGYTVPGVYRLNLNNTEVLLPCEFKNGNAFTVILRRQDNSINFQQTWHLYEFGFGNAHSNFWAGLAHIYALTLQGNNVLQINMQDWNGVNKNARYKWFSLGERNSRYRLHIGGFQGTIADDLSYHNMMPFSTYDAPDPHGCASSMKTGWWYNYCAYTLPTGTYYYGGFYHPGVHQPYDGMFWKDWYGYNYSLKFLSMTISHA
jgi:hypothetical protein